MKKKRYTEEQIAFALRQAESGTASSPPCHSTATGAVHRELSDSTLVILPSDVCWVSILEQHLPFLLRQPLWNFANLTRRRILARPSINVRVGIHRMCKQVANRRQARPAPFQVSLGGTAVLADRKLDLMPNELAKHTTGRSQSHELLEHHSHHSLSLFIRIQLDEPRSN